MEVDAVLFIGTIVAGVTATIKLWFPSVSGPLTPIIAGLVGIGVALVDTQIGVPDISIAQGLMIAAGAVGTMTAVDRV